MASYEVNLRGVAHAKALIDAKRFVLRGDWGAVQPKAAEQNRFLKSHSWEEYGEWHLALTDGAQDETKRRYAFIYGDLRRLHRMGLIACVYRASEWRHKEIELAAHDLLQYLDNVQRRDDRAPHSAELRPPPTTLLPITRRTVEIKTAHRISGT